MDADNDSRIEVDELLATNLFRPTGQLEEQLDSCREFLKYYGRMEPLRTGEDKSENDLDHIVFMNEIMNLAEIERLCWEKGVMTGPSRGFSMVVPSLMSGFKKGKDNPKDGKPAEKMDEVVPLEKGEAGPDN